MGLYTVTGGTGFLGSHLVTNLLSEGHKIRVMARNPPAKPLPPGAEFYQGSVLDPASVRWALAGSDGVFHLSGTVEHSRRSVNASNEATFLDGTLTVIRGAKAAGVRVVLASTSGVCAVSSSPSFIATDASPYATEATASWPYYRGKIAAERAAREVAEKEGVDLVCMRPTLLLGPGDTRLSSTRSVLDHLGGRIPIMPGGGLSLVDVRDAAAAFAAAMKRAEPGSAYLLGARNLTFEEYFRRLEEVSGAAAPRLRLPYPLVRGLAAAGSTLMGWAGLWDPSLDPVVVEMSAAYWYLDAERAKRDLGFSPRDYKETLKDTVDWIRAHRDEIVAS